MTEAEFNREFVWRAVKAFCKAERASLPDATTDDGMGWNLRAVAEWFTAKTVRDFWEHDRSIFGVAVWPARDKLIPILSRKFDEPVRSEGDSHV